MFQKQKQENVEKSPSPVLDDIPTYHASTVLRSNTFKLPSNSQLGSRPAAKHDSFHLGEVNLATEEEIPNKGLQHKARKPNPYAKLRSSIRFITFRRMASAEKSTKQAGAGDRTSTAYGSFTPQEHDIYEEEDEEIVKGPLTLQTARRNQIREAKAAHAALDPSLAASFENILNSSKGSGNGFLSRLQSKRKLGVSRRTDINAPPKIKSKLNIFGRLNFKSKLGKPKSRRKNSKRKLLDNEKQPVPEVEDLDTFAEATGIVSVEESHGSLASTPTDLLHTSELPSVAATVGGHSNRPWLHSSFEEKGTLSHTDALKPARIISL